MKQDMTVIDFFNILKKHIVLIATLSIFGLAVTGIRTHFFVKDTYYSTAQVTMQSTSSKSKIADDVSKVATYKKLGKSKKVVEEVQQDLKSQYNIKMSKQKIKSSYSISGDETTLVINIGSNTHNAKKAKIIANVAANAFVDKLSGFINNTKLTVTDNATLPEGPAFPNLKASMLKGFVAGLFISILAVIIIEMKKQQNEN